MAILKVPYNGEWAIIESPSAVRFTEQTLSETEKARARANIGAAAEGEAGGSSINIDSTLSIQGAAADAKATGDALTELEQQLAGISINVDSELSADSENAIQNKVVNAAISDLTARIGDTDVASQISTAIDGVTIDSIGAAAAEHTHTNAYMLDRIGSAVQDSTDLNNCVTPGIFYVTASVASTLDNSPTSAGFKLIVEKGYNNDRMIQTIRVGTTANAEWTRQYVNGEWGEWQRILKNSDVGNVSTLTYTSVTF